MAYNPSYDTDDSAVPAAIRRFLKNRLFELAGLAIFACLIATSIALATWSVNDPSLNHSLDRAAENWLGYPGAVAADELMQLLGLAVLALIAIPMAWSAALLGHGGIDRPLRSLAAWVACVFCSGAALAGLPAPTNWPLAVGLGGNAGDVLHGFLLALLAIGLKGMVAKLAAALVMAVLAVRLGFRAVGFGRISADENTGRIAAFGKAALYRVLAAIRHLYNDWRERRRQRKANALAPKGDILSRLAPARHGRRIEPVLSRQAATMMPRYLGEAEEDDVEMDLAGDTDDDEPGASRINRQGKTVKPGKRIKKDRLPKSEDFELPPLTLLAEPKRIGKLADLSDDALEQNARMLEGVLDDFGVKGQIVKVRPGPVVTLYELEPAPGIKSSRVISLSDDIARSMSAISARVAVVSGRNAIGIELPNSKRETVYLRELVASEAFEKTGQSLALALGKNIGGEPVF
ncbi:MAG: DNA translocase FtsK 4TM domain-containing protein, partial [Aestuariivirga sp.]